MSAQTVDNGNNGSVYQDFKTEFMWDAKVKIANRINVGESYCKSVLDLEAPKSSPYDYLNHAVFIGTLKNTRIITRRGILYNNCSL